jgi:arginyl-tRNA synthetase
MLENLIKELSKVSKLSPEDVSKVLVRTQDIDHGDYAFPCFSLAKAEKISPNICAENLKEKITLPAEFEKIETKGPYLNFFLDRKLFTKNILSEALKSGEKAGALPENGRTYIVEYSGPNIAKNLHVGHMRTTLIGLSLERIYKHLGFKVITINHLGDWGVQFGYIWAGVELWGMPKNADIDSLVEIYVKAVKLGKDQEEGKVSKDDEGKPDITKMARDYFIRLESGDKEALKFWEWCLDLSLKAFKEIYNRLEIHFDHYTGESFYSNQIGEVEEKVKTSGILEESRGARGVDLGKELGFVRIFADDGRSLYITRDIAAALYREKTYKAEKIIYVVGAQQSLHFKQLIEILRLMKENVAEKIVHVSYGFVPGMKTREGTVILFRDFLNEAHDLALKTYRDQISKRPENLDENEIAEKVAIGATYFYFLKHINTKDFNFSWDQALNFQGDTGAYLQYALARIYSIEANANQSGVESKIDDLLKFDAALLKENEAYQLVSQLSRFPEILNKAAEEYEPSHIASYTLDLAKNFGKAYNSLRVVGEEKAVALSRLALFVATRNVLKTALHLIGVPVVQRM